MAIASVQTRFAYGLRSDVVGNVNFIDEQNVIYPVGSNIVIYNIDQKTQRFIPTSPTMLGPSCLAISPNKRYLAIAEKGTERGQIVIHDLVTNKKKLLQYKEMQSLSFISISFSSDSKYLASLTDKPDQTLLYWGWDKAKVFASLKVSPPGAGTQAGGEVARDAKQVSFNPTDNTVLCLTGDMIYKLLRYSEGALKTFGYARTELSNYLSHCWITEEKLVLGTSNGRLQLFEGSDLKWEYNICDAKAGGGQSIRDGSQTTSVRASVDSSSKRTRFGDVSSTSMFDPPPRVPRIEYIISYSKGFICAGGVGLLHLFEKSDDRDLYRRKVVKVNNLPEMSLSLVAKTQPSLLLPVDGSDGAYTGVSLLDCYEVSCLSMSPSEDNLVASTKGNQLYSLLVSTADMTTTRTDQVSFDLLSHSFHMNQIKGLDVCLRKPLVATCSMDKTIRIWNFETNALELQKEFQEEAYSVALHPSGLFLLAGFSEKLRLMNILLDDIRVFKEFVIRGCRECAFAHGGHMFAAVNNNLIQIFSSYSFENIQDLKGHNGKVRSLAFSKDDQRLISCSADGAVYEWSIAKGCREGEAVHRQCIYTSLTLSPDAKTSYVVGSDGNIKELVLMDGHEVRRVPAEDTVLTQVALSRSGRMLFCGTSQGGVRAMKFPLSDPGKYNETQAHNGAVTRIKITYDDQYLITTGEDACVFMFKIIDKEGKGLKLEREINYAEEILITKSDLEEKNQLTQELKAKVEELCLDNDYQMRIKEMGYQDKIKGLTDKFINDHNALRSQVEKVQKENEQFKQESEESEQQMGEGHARELQEIEASNNQKLMAEYEKYQELQARNQRLQDQQERKVAELHAQRQRDMEENTIEFQSKLEERGRLLEQVQEELRQQMREHEELRQQLEDDADREILDLRNNYEHQLRQEKEKNELLRGDRGVFEKKCESQKKDISHLRKDIDQLTNEKSKLNSVIKSLENDIVGLKKEIQERDDTIHDKEKRIYDLKKKNQELEKFKFVLEYKIKELKKQIEPREQEIKEKKEQIHKMESELEDKSQSCKNLEHERDEKELKLKATTKELLSERQRARGLAALTRAFQVDLHNTVGLIQEPAQLKDSVVALYQNYFKIDEDSLSKGVGQFEVDAQDEYARQREHLERNVTALKKKLKKESEIHKSDNVRIMQENVTLIKEINELRKELKIARSTVHDLETAMVIAKRQGFDERQVPKPVIPATGLGKTEIVEPQDIIERQTKEIWKLRKEIQEATPKGDKLPPVSDQPMVAT
ncbi:WD repeat-containing protein 65-like [Oopsacas minuta]|uniref:WD repeat-containing protein 65-like n=1 Tax=Oopsacas minuta TaxID=111878 RepID=A0AAV7K225_9METZ|nr:WD repeat-containing protein 65-like [Oopsacas minuta]